MNFQNMDSRMYKSLDVIHEEHRALAAMLGGLRTLAIGYRDGQMAPDFKLLASMIRYIDEVPEKVHHPKEDQYLFARLRARWPEAIGIIRQLELEHTQGAARIAALRVALDTYQAVGSAGAKQFLDAINHYMEHEWRHMNREEHEIFPLARAHLTPEDWAEIDTAFLANGNPWEGPAGEYASLFSHIVNEAPAPVGLGQ